MQTDFYTPKNNFSFVSVFLYIALVQFENLTIELSLSRISAFMGRTKDKFQIFFWFEFFSVNELNNNKNACIKAKP